MGLKGSKPVLENPLSDKFYCPICRDGGLVHPISGGRVDYSQVVSCVCMLNQLAEERAQRYLQYCKLPVHTEHMTFEMFNDQGNASLIEARDAALQLAMDQGDIQWLTMLGGVDRGKTHLAVAICRRWLAREKAARYCFVPLLLKELRDGFELEGEMSYRQRFDLLCNVPLLILDDLGVERPTAWGVEQLQTIIHYRGINGLPMVVTSNRPIDELAGDGERRIASRLQRERWCRVVVMDVGEHRLAKEAK